jgi:hypothetical protein
MELVKQSENLVYTYKDIKILVRSKATAGDKFAVEESGKFNSETGKFDFNMVEFYRILVRRFVVGWEGVTDGGKPVAYSYDALSSLPIDHEQDFIIKLGMFIADKTGFSKVEAEASKKNA